MITRKLMIQSVHCKFSYTRKYPYYHLSEDQEREVRKALYKTILGSGEKDVHRVKEAVDKTIMVLKRGKGVS